MQGFPTFVRVFETPVDACGRFYVLAHDDAGVGAADEVASTFTVDVHNFPSSAGYGM
jgi:hypothetical protein